MKRMAKKRKDWTGEKKRKRKAIRKGGGRKMRNSKKEWTNERRGR